MALDRWIALIILMLCATYAYAAFFTMDGGMPPFMRRNPVWPSTFPKVLSVMAMGISLLLVLGVEKSDTDPAERDINYRRLTDYKLGQALGLIGLMIAYALFLRPAGFLISTLGFLVIGSVILGERRFHWMIPIAAIAAGSIWYLVQEVLGVFLRPLPFFMGV